MLDVGQQQLLVLLLVMQAERRPRKSRSPSSRCSMRRNIDSSTCGDSARLRRASGATEQSAARPRVHLPGCVVVGIEEEVVNLRSKRM